MVETMSSEVGSPGRLSQQTSDERQTIENSAQSPVFVWRLRQPFIHIFIKGFNTIFKIITALLLAKILRYCRSRNTWRKSSRARKSLT